jgi:exosome complex RNA-binding protein Rrp42 (RNase PH superfamily)
MQEAWEKDKEAIENGRPAINKILLSKSLYQKLKHLETLNKFFEYKGLDCFSLWLDVVVTHDDKKYYPNINVI